MHTKKRESLPVSRVLVLPEEMWNGPQPKRMPTTRGEKFFRWLVCGKKASEISNQPIDWVIRTYTYYCALILSGNFDIELFSEPSNILLRYGCALEAVLFSHGYKCDLMKGVYERSM